MFLRDHWYAVAWDHDIKHTPFARSICGEAIVVFLVHQESDILQALCCLYNRWICAHRPRYGQNHT
jgi:phenylpropionate dioxygenase-like ring-hydroxylating dioxygenase large terminal subunit